MNTNELAEIGFNTWFLFNISNRENLLNTLPTNFGVYVIAIDQPFGRFIGESDIVYIGSTIRKNGGIRTRIKEHFKPGKSQQTNKRISELLNTNIFLRFSVVSKRKPNNARELEKKLLNKYVKQHGELPPLNRSEPK